MDVTLSTDIATSKEQKRAYVVIYRAENIERNRAYQRAYYAANKERIATRDKELYPARKERKRAYREAHREEKRAYDVIYNAAPRTEPCGRGFWHTDHCHGTGKVRGILCHHCNVGIGHFNDAPEALRNAALYLEKHQCLAT